MNDSRKIPRKVLRKWKWLYASARLAFSLLNFTGGFVFGYSAETCFHVIYVQHAALKGLKCQESLGD